VPAFSHAQTVVATGTAATVVVTKPASCTAGDLLILTLGHIAALSVTAAPVGFTQAIDAFGTATFATNRVKVWWREATAGEPLAYTATTQFGGDRWTFMASVFRGHRVGNPMDGAVSSTFGSSVNITCPAIALSGSPCALVAIGTMYGGAGTGPTQFGLTGFFTAGVTTANVNNTIVAYNAGPWAAGNTGTTTISASGTEAVHDWVGVMLGIAVSQGAATSLVIGSLSLMGVGR
jgi:hypothetical protein